MQNSREPIVTASHLLFPLSLVAFVVFIFLAFQTSAIMRDRQELMEARSKQEKPLEQVQKVQAQLDALAQGTAKLARGGNKDADAIIKHMEQMGITINPPNGAAPQDNKGPTPTK